MKPKKFYYEKYDNVLPGITQSKKNIPQWYRDSERFIGSDKPKIVPQENLGLKLCVPFLDSLTAGYQIVLAQDVLVEQTPEGASMSWKIGRAPLKPRDIFNTTLPVPAGCSPTQITWSVPVAMQTPPGYSALVTHPFNRYDLPFITLTGIIDLEYGSGGGNLPFFVSDTFEGIIPQGTPIAQVLPFKREDWVLTEKEGLKDLGEDNFKRGLSYIYGWYKKNIWQKKNYD